MQAIEPTEDLKKNFIDLNAPAPGVIAAAPGPVIAAEPAFAINPVAPANLAFAEQPDDAEPALGHEIAEVIEGNEHLAIEEEDSDQEDPSHVAAPTPFFG